MLQRATMAGLLGFLVYNQAKRVSLASDSSSQLESRPTQNGGAGISGVVGHLLAGHFPPRHTP